MGGVVVPVGRWQSVRPALRCCPDRSATPGCLSSFVWTTFDIRLRRSRILMVLYPCTDENSEEEDRWLGWVRRLFGSFGRRLGGANVAPGPNAWGRTAESAHRGPLPSAVGSVGSSTPCRGSIPAFRAFDLQNEALRRGKSDTGSAKSEPRPRVRAVRHIAHAESRNVAAMLPRRSSWQPAG